MKFEGERRNTWKKEMAVEKGYVGVEGA